MWRKKLVNSILFILLNLCFTPFAFAIYHNPIEFHNNTTMDIKYITYTTRDQDYCKSTSLPTIVRANSKAQGHSFYVANAADHLPATITVGLKQGEPFCDFNFICDHGKLIVAGATPIAQNVVCGMSLSTNDPKKPIILSIYPLGSAIKSKSSSR